MKKLKLIIVAAIAGIAFTGVNTVFAVEGYGSAGCGLGSLVFGNAPGEVQIFAATTNATSYSQTFGITSGTSNCEKQAKFSSNERLNQFVASNMDSLAQDISSGYGESLDTLVELLGVSTEQRGEAYTKLQANFSDIFTSSQVETADVIDHIVMVLNR